MFTNQNQKTGRLAVALAVTIILSAGVFFITASATARASALAEECDEQCRQDLATARAATAQYHQESRALADGFFSDPICVQAPDVGAMGIHYLNPSRMDTNVDPASPEVLLYEPQADGTRRLVGAEYVSPVIVNGSPWFGPGPPPNGQYNAAPVLFGRTFNGPMPGHNPHMSWHYDLHVWLWRNNPSGMFALFNPKVSCQ